MISRRTPGLPGFAFLCVLPCLAPAQDAAPPETPERASQESEADALLARSVDALYRLPQLQAAVRYMVRGPRGNRLVGRGRYEELQQGTGRLTRFELVFDVAGEHAFRLLQIYDGQWLWTKRTLGETSEVTREAPGKREENGKSRADRGDETSTETTSIATPQAGLNVGAGGLSGWTDALRRDFTFGAAQSGILHLGKQRLPVMRLDGCLSPTTQQRLGLKPAPLPASNADPPLPGMLPGCVRVIVGSNDLLPRRIEFYRTNHDEQPMATLDFHTIETGPIETGPIETGSIETGSIETGPIETGPTARPARERFHFDPGNETRSGNVDGR